MSNEGTRITVIARHRHRKSSSILVESSANVLSVLAIRPSLCHKSTLKKIFFFQGDDSEVKRIFTPVKSTDTPSVSISSLA